MENGGGRGAIWSIPFQQQQLESESQKVYLYTIQSHFPRLFPAVSPTGFCGHSTNYHVNGCRVYRVNIHSIGQKRTTYCVLVESS